MSESEENNKRVEVLFNKHYQTLIKYANSLTKDETKSEDIVSNIIEYLLTRPNKNIYYKDSFNLLYINKMIYCRFDDELKANAKFDEYNEDIHTQYEEEYDIDTDQREQTLLDLYIETINETRTLNIDKYADVYIKYKLYKTSIKTIAKIKSKNETTIYSHFSKLNKWVEQTYREKIEKITDNQLN